MRNGDGLGRNPGVVISDQGLNDFPQLVLFFV